MDSRTAGAGGAGLHVSFRTTCGRQVRVGHLVLGGGRHPARRVSLGISAMADAGDGSWAGLTPGEARRLAAALLMHAGAYDTRPPQTLGSSRRRKRGAESFTHRSGVQGQVHRFSSGTPAMT